MLGLILGGAFHAVLALAGNVPFSALALALYVAFLPGAVRNTDPGQDHQVPGRANTRTPALLTARRHRYPGSSLRARVRKVPAPQRWPQDGPHRIAASPQGFRPAEPSWSTGAGKTSLVKLLCRFYEPTAGTIAADGIDPRPLDVDNWTFFVGPFGFAYRPVGAPAALEKRHLGGGLFKHAYDEWRSGRSRSASCQP